MLLAGIFLLAGFGALIRYGFSEWIAHPYGILLANVLGSALIGYLLTSPPWLASLSPYATRIVAVGFLGALTTFSSYSVDVVSAFTNGQLLKAGALVIGHNVLCIGCCLVTYRFAA